jgi:hypothetical protein
MPLAEIWQNRLLGSYLLQIGYAYFCFSHTRHGILEIFIFVSRPGDEFLYT